MMNMREMLGESGRTMSPKAPSFNRDRAMLAGLGQARSVADVQAMDNEPRFEDRPPELQIFTLNSSIDNLMKNYEMMVRNQNFQGAQMIADQIDQLQQQKIQIQNQNVPFMLKEGNLGLNPNAGMRGTQAMMGETGRTMSNQDRQEIDDILQSIAK